MDASTRSATSSVGDTDAGAPSSSSSFFRRLLGKATSTSTANDDSIRSRISEGIAVLAGTPAEDVDVQLRSLYQDPAGLEKRCEMAAKGLAEAEAESNDGSDAAATAAAAAAVAAAAAAREQRRITSYFFSDKTPQSVIASLPDAFFSPEFDAAAQLPMEVASWGQGDLTDRFMTKIEDFDTDKDMILSSLADLIEANYSQIVECMRDINAIDTELSQAATKTILCREKLAMASAALCAGPVKVASMQAKRDRLALAADTVRCLKALMDVHKAVQSDLTIGALARAAEGASSLLFSLQNDAYGYGQFRSLSNLKGVVRRNFVSVRQKSDKALLRMCSRKFAPAEYADIVKGYLVLDHAAETLGLPLGTPAPSRLDGQQDAPPSSDDLFDALGCMEGLDRRVLRFLTEDIDACRHSALLELMYASQHRKQKAAAAIDLAGVQLFAQMSTLEMVDLAETPMDELYRMVGADLVAQCVKRTCGLLADVVHTHYLITQWHRAPFDPRNEDSAFLHRCAPTAPEDDGARDEVTGDSPMRKDPDTEAAVDSPTKGAPADSVKTKKLSTSKLSSLFSANFKLPKPSSSSSGAPASAAAGTKSGATATTDAGSTQRVRNAEATRNAIARAFERNWPRTSSKVIASLAHSGALHSPSQRSRSLINGAADSPDQPHPRGAAGASMTADEMKVLRLRGARMAVVYERMAVDRAALWALVVAALADMLRCLSMPAAVPFDDFLAVLWAVSTTVNLGREFCGAESKALLDALHAKAREYLANTHAESFQVLRQMVDSEAWRCVPVALDDMGGVLGIVKKSMPPLQQSNPPADTNGAGNKSILMMFVSGGNPFYVATTPSEPNGNGNGHGTSHHQSAAVAATSLASSLAVEYECFMEMLSKDEGRPGQHDVSGGRSALCVTQTLLNGLARYAGRYLQKMHLLPSTAPDVFASLCQLFDYYLCAVFTGFVGSTERRLLAHRSARLSSTAPAHADDFEVLNAYMERIQSETVLLSPAQHAHLMDCVAAHAQQQQEVQDARDKQQWDNANSGRRISQIANALASSMSAAAAAAEAAAQSAASHSLSLAQEASSVLQGDRGGVDAAGGSVAVTSGNYVAAGSSGDHPADGSGGGGGGGGAAAGMLGGEGGGGSSSSTATATVAVPLATVLSVSVPECMRTRSQDQRSFYSMCERIVAAESCSFAAMILLEIKPKLERLTAVWDEGISAPSACVVYISRYQAVVRQLQTLVYRSMCPQLIQSDAVLAKMCDSSRCRWDAKQLRQTPHEWVFDLVESCRETWSYLRLQSNLGAGAGITVTEAVQEQIWAELCQAAFDTALEGFSRAKRCSPEGRAVMLMDVAELEKGLQDIHPVPLRKVGGGDVVAAGTEASPVPRGQMVGAKEYVDNFVHATHMPEDDLIVWVNHNWRSYAYRHIVGLLNMTLAGSAGLTALTMSGVAAKRLKDAIAHVDSLYEQLLAPGSAGVGVGVGPTDSQPSAMAMASAASLPLAPLAAPDAPPVPEKSKEKEKLSRRIAKSLGISKSP